jgi:UDP-2,3-diacylglucosamine pyrophosphatase LpxH
MPHRNNILYRICEIKPFFRTCRPNLRRKICHILQSINAKFRCLIYSSCNAQKVCTRAILTKSSSNVPGKHAEAFWNYGGVLPAGVELLVEATHRTADGRELLVLHGDGFDGIVAYARWLAFLGDQAYAAALKLSDVVNLARRWFGLPHWSLSAFLKHKVKNAASFLADFEHAASRAACLRGTDGVICGHIHSAQIRTIEGILYCNDGDWVESCTALIEDARDRLEIVEWTSFAHERNRSAQKAARKALIAAPRHPVAA